MHISYSIEPENRLVIMIAVGEVAPPDVRATQETLRADPAFDETFGQLYDFRQATPVQISSADVGSLLQTSPFALTSRRAYVTAPGVSFGLGRVAEIRGELAGQMVKVFNDLEPAREWLRE